MADKSEALQLADALETRAITFRDKAEAAAELRRLHDHTQMLEHAYKSACDIVEEQDKKLVDLKAVNQGLLVALNKLVDHIDFIPTDPYYRNETKELMDAARAAIARAEGELNERP
jgi:hypothetical protein